MEQYSLKIIFFLLIDGLESRFPMFYDEKTDLVNLPPRHI